jgi:phosphatidylglycerophosphatase A
MRKSGGAAAAIATWFGCGYSPVAPGTAGSLGALAPAFLLKEYAGFQPWHFALLAAAVTPVAIWAAGRVARDRGEEDPSLVVVDEVAGQWVSLAGAAALDWKTWLAAFVLFRLFDIWKPFPVRRLEALPGGIGIVADDLAAGIYGALVLFVAGCFNF